MGAGLARAISRATSEVDGKRARPLLVDGVPHEREIAVADPTGVQRFTGFVVAMKNLGIIQECAGAAGAQPMHLGAQQAPCEFARGPPRGLNQLVCAFEGCRPPSLDAGIEEIRAWDLVVDEKLTTCSQLMCGRASRYVRPFIRRKMLYCHLRRHALGARSGRGWP